MKKQFFLFALALFAFGTTSAQFNTAEYLDINNVKARFMVHGDMFWDPVTGLAAYEFPKGSGKHSNFAASIWIGGIDQATNTLKVAAQTYRQGGNDYWPGPLGEFNGATIDSVTSANWAQIWKINKSTIDSFRQLTTITLANIPQSILVWPGRKSANALTPNNTPLSVPDREMAPYVDVNNDNVYNPLDGDYPDIKGDQMLFWVFNDKADSKASGSDAIGLEIHGTAYACTQVGLDNTTFVNLRVYNWSTSILDSTYIGVFNDADLGYAFDDFVGYDSSHSMGITYNGDAFDETAIGYGNDLTQTGLLFLKGPSVSNPLFPNPGQPQYVELPPSSFTSYTNNSGRTGLPSIAAEFYNALNGKWRDGTPIMEGCNPSDTVGTPTKFVFPDDPSVMNGLSEVACNRPPTDRNTLISSGPFQLYPGIVPSDITFAIINTDVGSNNNNFNEIKRLADSATLYANGCGQPMLTLSVPKLSSGSLKAYPNPADHYFILEDSDQQTKSIAIYNSVGQLIFEKNSKEQKVKIDTEELADGIYFLKVEKDHSVFSQSILIR